MEQYTLIHDRGSPHESTIVTSTGLRKPDPLHFTFQFKNKELAAQSKHYTAHAYSKLDPQTAKPVNVYDTILEPKLRSDGKTLAIDPDDYFDRKKKRQWNQWDKDKNNLEEYTEEVIEGWVLGDDFVAYTVEEEQRLSPKETNEIKADQELWKAKTEEAMSENAIGSEAGEDPK